MFDFYDDDFMKSQAGLVLKSNSIAGQGGCNRPVAMEWDWLSAQNYWWGQCLCAHVAGLYCRACIVLVPKGGSQLSRHLSWRNCCRGSLKLKINDFSIIKTHLMFWSFRHSLIAEASFPFYFPCKCKEDQRGWEKYGFCVCGCASMLKWSLRSFSGS